MTVRELAKVCDVHYNTMRKWLVDNKVNKTNQTRNAQFLLTDEVINRAKKHFNIVDEKKENINNVLVEQLKQKDIQIIKQQEIIENLNKLLENQQVLTLKAQEKVELLEMKRIKDNEEQKTTDEKNVEETKKKSWWKFW